MRHKTEMTLKTRRYCNTRERRGLARGVTRGVESVTFLLNGRTSVLTSL